MFQLHKWFFDCVTPAGEVLVVYAATLRWGWLRVGYSATLWNDGMATTTHTRFGRPSVPAVAPGGITFADARLGVSGRWAGPVRAQEQRLWGSDRGEVRWHCHLPAAAFEGEFRGRPLRGTGYVEHLALDVAPWHLPIDELRWGRFHGGGHSLVWIQWSGQAPLRLCLLDGVAVEASAIRDDGFELATGERLQLGTPRVLRAGRLGRTVLAERLLRFLPLPRAVRQMQETKWFASGRLRASAGDCDGSAVHEVVRWP